MDGFEHGAKEALTGLSERLDDVKEDWKELRKGVKDAQSQFTSCQQEANIQFDHFRCQFAELQSSLSSTTAIQLNVLRKLLEISSNHLRPRFRPRHIAFLSFPRLSARRERIMAIDFQQLVSFLLGY
jgi:lipopolysaccharide biosynthesis regulator YciM